MLIDWLTHIRPFTFVGPTDLAYTPFPKKQTTPLLCLLRLLLIWLPFVSRRIRLQARSPCPTYFPIRCCCNKHCLARADADAEHVLFHLILLTQSRELRVHWIHLTPPPLSFTLSLSLNSFLVWFCRISQYHWTCVQVSIQPWLVSPHPHIMWGRFCHHLSL